MSDIDRQAAIARCLHYTAEVREGARRHAGTMSGLLYGKLAEDLAAALGELMREPPSQA